MRGYYASGVYLVGDPYLVGKSADAICIGRDSERCAYQPQLLFEGGVYFTRIVKVSAKTNNNFVPT